MPPQLDELIRRHFRRQFDPSKAAPPVANSFIENKNPQTHPEAFFLVPTELGKGVEIFIRTRQADRAFGTDSCHEVFFCHFTLS